MKRLFYCLTLWATLLNLSACRNDKPPQLGLICTLDGFGGGDCVTSDGTKVYKSPSEMKNFWATTQVDEANFTSWCYKTTPAGTNAELEKLKTQMTASK